MRTTSKPKKSSIAKSAKSSLAAKIAKPKQGALAGDRKRGAGQKAGTKRAAAYRGLGDAAPLEIGEASSRRSTGRAAAAERAEATALPGMITSKVTDRSQTTLPPGVRQVLGIKSGQRLGYVFDNEGVRLINASSATEHEDPVLQQFLALLGRHLAAGPVDGGAVAFPPELLERARAVTADVEIDHDAPIDGAITL